MKRAITFLCLFLVSSCGFGRGEISKELETQIQNNNWERIDLSQVGGSAWQRVCVLGPYSDNNRAEQTLGFKWDLEKKTSVLSSDSVNLLVFVEGKDVIAYVEHPRSLGDFAKLSGQCFDRVDAKLVRDKTRKDEWVSFVTEK
jgi:hypothetical protein